MAALRNKIDFALVFTATKANPNGDPLDGNRPRTDMNGFGEVSDVCLKRKIRNRVLDMTGDIFVQSDDNRIDEYRSLKDRAMYGCKALSEASKMGSRVEFAKIACETWFDVRAFGQVFAFAEAKKKKKGSEAEDDAGEGENSDAVSIGIRGPVSIQMAVSAEPVSVQTMQITKSVNLETGADPDKRGKDTMGTKYFVDFGVYTTFGSINAKQAEKTGFSEEDAETLKEALRTLFVNDETAARPAGSMEVVKLIWWKHNCEIGQYSPAKVHHLLHIVKKPEVQDPHSIDDYEITVDTLPGLEFEDVRIDG